MENKDQAEEEKITAFDIVRAIIFIPYAWIQASMWVICTVKVAGVIYAGFKKMDIEYPEWQIMFFIGYFIWTNQIMSAIIKANSE